MTHALLVDDDAELRQLVTGYLEGFGIVVTAVPDGRGLRRVLAAHPPGSFDVLLLDLMLPDASGLDLCRWVRQTQGRAQTLPIVMLTAQGDPASRVIGLEMGADDYLPKPFEPRELVARIHAVLRRTQGGAGASRAAAAGDASLLHFNGWVFDRLQHQLISPKQVVVALSNAEFRLLSAFVEHPKRVLGRERLRDVLRAPGAAGGGRGDERAVDLAVSRLRQKLGDARRAPSQDDAPELIRTVRGEGYLFNADVT